MMKRSWQNPANPLYKMLQGCGEPCGWWVKQAVEFVPPEIRADCERKCAFYSTARRDACRVSREVCEDREIILLSERIIPDENAQCSDTFVTYFIFVVLHEVAHVIKRHRSPNELTPDQNKAQEKEADQLALDWFNKKAVRLNLSLLEMEEVEAAKERNRRCR